MEVGDLVVMASHMTRRPELHYRTIGTIIDQAWPPPNVDLVVEVMWPTGRMEWIPWKDLEKVGGD